jgi:hypothetical protein
VSSRYRVGAPIKSLSELMRQDLIFYMGKHLINKAFFQNWQMRYCQIEINFFRIKKAILIKKGPKKCQTN